MSSGDSKPILPPGYAIVEGYPSIPDYLRIRSSTGLTPKNEAQAAKIAGGSWYGCYATYTPDAGSQAPQTVGMGRVIGDGGWYFHIADMGVLAEHQKKGLGDAILKNIMAHIWENKAEGKPYISLLADKPGRKLYEKNGFVDTAPKETGMMFKMEY